MRKYLLFFIVVLFIPLCISAQESYRQRLYESYVHKRMHLWEGIIGEMNRRYEQTGDQDLLHQLCFAYYGYIGYLISEEEDAAGKESLKVALNRTARLEEVTGGSPEVLALQGALLGYKIVLSKFSSLVSGPKALRYIKKANEAPGNCFNCHMEMGNMKFYTPAFLGGSKAEAIPYYERAVELVERSSLKKERDWIYMNTLLLLANAYSETGRKDRAQALYESLLEYEPRATWIRKEYCPGCPGVQN